MVQAFEEDVVSMPDGIKGQFEAAACVLAGGRGLRLRGADKLRLELGGVRLFERLHAALAVRFSEILVATSRPEAFSAFPVRCIADAEGLAGPLAGLVAAFKNTDKPWLFVTAVDMPFYDPAWLAYLEKALAGRLNAGSRPLAVLAASGSYLEPFQAIYHRDVLAVWERWLAGEAEAAPVSGSSRLSIQRLLQGQPVCAISEADQAPFVPERLFFNINTPEDMGRAEAFLQQAAVV